MTASFSGATPTETRSALHAPSDKVPFQGASAKDDAGPQALSFATPSAHMAVMLDLARHPILRAMSRGLRGRCPACGEGHLFYRYLKISPACGVCGHDLDQYPSDDGPAYFTILLVGHLVVAPLLLFPIIWRSPIAVIVPGVLIPLAGLTLLILPRVKGAVVGLLHALKVHRADAAIHTTDRY